MDNDIKAKLKTLSMGLMKFHKGLIDLEFSRIEHEQKITLDPNQKLNLLLHEPSLEWLRPLSQFISTVDELYYKKDGPIKSGEVQALRTEGIKILDALKIANIPEAIKGLLENL